mgnify:CR=1 FL=1
MADVLTSEQRRKCMSRIRSKNTKPEIIIRKFLFAHGFRFRINVKRLPGTPDIVLRKYQTVIFVNGCFWHGHEGCRYFRLPKSNVDFWKNKIGIDVAFNHRSFIGGDLLRLQAGAEIKNMINIGIYVCGTKSFLKHISNDHSSIVSFERVKWYLENFYSVLTVPILLVGFEE